MELKFRHSAALEMPFPRYPVLPKSKFSDSGRKPWTIVHGFDQIAFDAHNSSLERAMTLWPFPFRKLSMLHVGKGAGAETTFSSS